MVSIPQNGEKRNELRINHAGGFCEKKMKNGIKRALFEQCSDKMKKAKGYFNAIVAHLGG